VPVFARELHWAIELFPFQTTDIYIVWSSIRRQTHGKMRGSVSRLRAASQQLPPALHMGMWRLFFRLHQREDDFWMWNFISRNLQEPKSLWQPMARSKHQGQWYFLTLK
jgi:hypothetical protein